MPSLILKSNKNEATSITLQDNTNNTLEVLLDTIEEGQTRVSTLALPVASIGDKSTPVYVLVENEVLKFKPCKLFFDENGNVDLTDYRKIDNTIFNNFTLNNNTFNGGTDGSTVFTLPDTDGTLATQDWANKTFIMKNDKTIATVKWVNDTFITKNDETIATVNWVNDTFIMKNDETIATVNWVNDTFIPNSKKFLSLDISLRQDFTFLNQEQNVICGSLYGNSGRCRLTLGALDTSTWGELQIYNSAGHSTTLHNNYLLTKDIYITLPTESGMLVTQEWVKNSDYIQLSPIKDLTIYSANYGTTAPSGTAITGQLYFQYID